MESVGEVGAVVLTLPSSAVAGSVAPLRVANLLYVKFRAEAPVLLALNRMMASMPLPLTSGVGFNWVAAYWIVPAVLSAAFKTVHSGGARKPPFSNWMPSTGSESRPPPPGSRIKRQPHVGPVEAGDAVDPDVHQDRLATLNLDGREAESSVMVGVLCACETLHPWDAKLQQ